MFGFVFFLQFCSCVVCFCCFRLSFFSTKPRHWLGKTRVARFLLVGGKLVFSMEKTGVAKIVLAGKNRFCHKIVRQSIKIRKKIKYEILLLLI